MVVDRPGSVLTHLVGPLCFETEFLRYVLGKHNPNMLEDTKGRKGAFEKGCKQAVMCLPAIEVCQRASMDADVML
jgi:hypothetical protein